MSKSVLHEPLKNRPKCRVELHVHLDGAIRHETIWEVMKKKGMKLPGDGSLKELTRVLTVEEPIDLSHFLSSFFIFMPAFAGDLEAIERISFEFVEDQAKECVAYCEARYCPHLLLPPKDSPQEGKEITADDIVKATLRGVQRGEKEYNVKVRLILCCIRGLSQFNWDILRLCEEYRDKGVVGIDIAGDEASLGAEVNTPLELEVFKAAKDKGIHRTIHAGEAGPAKNVEEALDMMHAERIGHGYRVVEDENLYQRCLSERVHFEMCPHSSYATGAMKSLLTKSKRHPILRMAEDNASFSVNTDDPTVTNTRLSDEYNLLQSWGFTEAQLTRANFEAARNSFLPSNEKSDLIEHLKNTYGIISHAETPINKPEAVLPAVDIADIHVLTPAPTPDLLVDTNSVIEATDSSSGNVSLESEIIQPELARQDESIEVSESSKVTELTDSSSNLTESTDLPVASATCVSSDKSICSSNKTESVKPEAVKTVSVKPEAVKIKSSPIIENKSGKIEKSVVKEVSKAARAAPSPRPSVKIATWDERL